MLTQDRELFDFHAGWIASLMEPKNMNHEPPTHLDGIAKQKWAEIIDVLQARGDTLDAGVLTAVGCYAVASSQWTEASLKVQELGLIVKSPQGFPQENPSDHRTEGHDGATPLGRAVAVDAEGQSAGPEERHRAGIECRQDTPRHGREHQPKKHKTA